MQNLPKSMTFIIKSVTGCNLSCSYCYMEAGSHCYSTIMADEILKKTIKEVASLQLNRVEFSWHGGEPLIAKKVFYKRAKELQLMYLGSATQVKNCLQTNGTIITKDWVNFFVDYKFGVGLSIDGPEDINDSNRHYKSGKGSFLSVMQGIKVLQEAGYDVHVIPVVTKAAVHRVKEIFDFFIENGINHFAFTPCFPKRSGLQQSPQKCDQHTVNAEEFGIFMIDIFDLWMKLNNPNVTVRYLKEITKMLLGGEPSLCIFRRSHFCYRFLTIDTNGDIFPCDSYMSEEFLLGNIRHSSLRQVLSSPKYIKFKENVVKVSDDCKCCPVYDICGGGCSFYRYFEMKDFCNKSYYCESMKMLVNHISNTLSLNLKGE